MFDKEGYFVTPVDNMAQPQLRSWNDTGIISPFFKPLKCYRNDVVANGYKSSFCFNWEEAEIEWPGCPAIAIALLLF